MASDPSFLEMKKSKKFYSKKLKPILWLTTDKILPARSHHRQAETLTPTALQWDFRPFMES